MFNLNYSRHRENNVYFFGVAGKISENDIDEKVVKQSEVTFLGRVLVG